jgi:heme-degrading monooxygenase HmoA
MLDVLKTDDESGDEFLARLARRERDVDELSGFAESAGIVDTWKRLSDGTSNVRARTLRE